MSLDDCCTQDFAYEGVSHHEAVCGPDSTTLAEITNEDVLPHLKLVKVVAYHIKKGLPEHVGLDDLCQAGMIGLIDALRRYSPERGASINTYIRLRVRGAIYDHLRVTDQLSRGSRVAIRRAGNTQLKLKADGLSATESAVAEEIGMDVEYVRRAVLEGLAMETLPLDRPGADGDFALEDIVADERAISPFQHLCLTRFNSAFRDAIKTLPKSKQKMLHLYYTEGLNLKDIGKIIGVGESRVCQMHAEIIRVLKSTLNPWAGLINIDDCLDPFGSYA